MALLAFKPKLTQINFTFPTTKGECEIKPTGGITPYQLWHLYRLIEIVKETPFFMPETGDEAYELAIKWGIQEHLTLRGEQAND